MDIEKEFHDFRQVMINAGKYAKEYFDSDVSPSTLKADGSILTEIDGKIERILREHIAERFPEDTVVGEEYGADAGASEFVWYLDPIDGTNNFVRKIPFFGVTATRLGSTPEDSFSIVHNPVTGQVFASLMEDGTYENERLCNLQEPVVDSKYFITVSTMKSEPWMMQARYNLYGAIATEFGKSGHYSSALLEFAYVAAGRLDGFLAMGFTSWDTAAGLYLVKAAGGAISIWKDEQWQRYDGPIKSLYGDHCLDRVTVFASHAHIHDRFIEFVGDPRKWAEK